MAGGIGAAGIGAGGENERREPDERRGSLAAIAFEIGLARHRIVVKVEACAPR